MHTTYIYIYYCIIPVSYTHLDVYKRQILYMHGNNRCSTNIITKIPNSAAAYGRGQELFRLTSSRYPDWIHQFYFPSCPIISLLLQFPVSVLLFFLFLIFTTTEFFFKPYSGFFQQLEFLLSFPWCHCAAGNFFSGCVQPSLQMCSGLISACLLYTSRCV